MRQLYINRHILKEKGFFSPHTLLLLSHASFKQKSKAQLRDS